MSANPLDHFGRLADPHAARNQRQALLDIPVARGFCGQRGAPIWLERKARRSGARGCIAARNPWVMRIDRLEQRGQQPLGDVKALAGADRALGATGRALPVLAPVGDEP